MWVQFSETPRVQNKTNCMLYLSVCVFFLIYFACLRRTCNTNQPTKTPKSKPTSTQSQLDDQITTSNRVTFWRSRHNKTIRAVSPTNRLHIRNPSPVAVVATYNHVHLQWTTITVRIVHYQQRHRQQQRWPLAITAPVMRYRQPLQLRR